MEVAGLPGLDTGTTFAIFQSRTGMRVSVPAGTSAKVHLIFLNLYCHSTILLFFFVWQLVCFCLTRVGNFLFLSNSALCLFLSLMKL